jgi:hypothetical protein
LLSLFPEPLREILFLEGKFGRIRRSPSKVNREEYCSIECGDPSEKTLKVDDRRGEHLEKLSRQFYLNRPWLLFTK